MIRADNVPFTRSSLFRALAMSLEADFVVISVDIDLWLRRAIDFIRRCTPFLVVILACFIYVSLPRSAYYPPTGISGHSDPGYEHLKELFKNVSKEERGGIAMVLMKRGQIVVDQWAGYADPTANQRWKRDTLAVAFSTTKIFVSIIFTLLQRENRFNYNDKVSKFWPEFASNGKDNVTILDILDHKAGLLRFSREFSLEDSLDQELMGRIIEQTVPQWTPGEKMGYSGVAYGYLIDQMVMRLDRKKRTACEFFNQEIKPHSKDPNFYIGLPDDENHRVARVTNPSLLASAKAHLSRPINYLTIMYNFFSNDMLAEYSAKYPAFLDLMSPSVVPSNSPVVRSLPLISSNGIGTARAMAEAIMAVSRLLTREEKERMMIPIGQDYDFVLSKTRIFGRGVSYIRHPNQDDRYIVSFWGNGLQMVAWDPIKETVFVVFRNGLKAGDNGVEEMNQMLKEAFH